MALPAIGPSPAQSAMSLACLPPRRQPQVVDQGLRPADREGRNHHSATRAARCILDHAGVRGVSRGKHTGQTLILSLAPSAEDYQTW